MYNMENAQKEGLLPKIYKYNPLKKETPYKQSGLVLVGCFLCALRNVKKRLKMLKNVNGMLAFITKILNNFHII